jgi:predicted ribosomally synthesized peptide with SipW-like signal peptide
MSNDDNSYLSRRKALGGIAALTAAGAAGAGGTYALLSDTEQSTDNTLSAGTLNLVAGGTNDSPTTTLTVTNGGTGSSGRGTTTVTNVGSLDGYLNFDVGQVTDAENGSNDPEREAEGGSVGSEGELSEFLTLRLGYDTTGDGTLQDDEVVAEGSIDGMEHVQFNPGVTVSGNGGTREFVAEWEIDDEAGNEVQSDEVEVDFTFELVERQTEADVVLTGDTPYGQGAGFANAWDTSGSLAHTGSGSWGTIDHSPQSSYKQGFYFAGEFSSTESLPDYTVSDIAEISYWLYEPDSLDGVDIYLNIYTEAEGDGDDAASWYDSRLQALPSKANNGSPNFTPGEWNEFNTRDSAGNTLAWSDTGRGGNFVTPLPKLSDLRSQQLDWSNYGGNLSITHDYRDETVRALSLQTGSQSGVDLEAYIDDVTVELLSGETVTYDLES